MQGNARERMREGNEAGVVGRRYTTFGVATAMAHRGAYETNHIETQLVSRWRWREGQEWATMGV